MKSLPAQSGSATTPTKPLGKVIKMDQALVHTHLGYALQHHVTDKGALSLLGSAGTAAEDFVKGGMEAERCLPVIQSVSQGLYI